MNVTLQIPATQNDAWGFWGTMNENATAACPLAMSAISDVTSRALVSVRIFLDSRFGRPFANDALNEMLWDHTIEQASDAAVTRWMGWTIVRQTSKDFGILKGLPYLTGFVIHCEIAENMAAGLTRRFLFGLFRSIMPPFNGGAYGHQRQTV